MKNKILTNAPDFTPDQWRELQLTGAVIIGDRIVRTASSIENTKRQARAAIGFSPSIPTPQEMEKMKARNLARKIQRDCPVCNGDGKIMSAQGRKLRAVPCPQCSQSLPQQTVEAAQ